ncbi:MAG: adenylyltransferase, partial [Desulfobacteraceae bacterium]|nr:adenylyltransferase [Desulfobacteraceae bacterium]
MIVDKEQHEILKTLSATLPDVILNDRQICDFELLVTGVFAPLNGFMTRVDYESVLDRMRLSSGDLWPVPVCLDIHDTLGRTLEVGQSVVLRDPEGFLLGVMTLEDIWPVDREAEAMAVYGTRDRTHPGVEYLFRHCGSYYIGGPIQALNLPIHPDFPQIRLTPAEIRERFHK